MFVFWRMASLLIKSVSSSFGVFCFSAAVVDGCMRDVSGVDVFVFCAVMEAAAGWVGGGRGNTGSTGSGALKVWREDVLC